MKQILEEESVDLHYQKAVDMALWEVEMMARDILEQHKNLKYFVMAMGTYYFVDKKENIIDTTEEYMTANYHYRWRDSKPYFANLNEFIGKWDSVLKLTGNPMKFTATGEIITDW